MTVMFRVDNHRELPGRKVLFPNQPIQWHLPSTSHDRCPRCGAGLGYLSRYRRACMGNDATKCPPGTVWESSLTPDGFLLAMYNEWAEVVALTRRPGRPRRA